jgi:ribosomal protein S18 acetylase RimI-like enzyme
VDNLRVDDTAGEPGPLTARSGGLDDLDALVRIMFQAPSREAVAMAGSTRAAERFGTILFRNSLTQGTNTFLVAEDASGLVGFAELSRGTDIPPFPIVARAAVQAMGLVGAIRAAGRSWSRMRVDVAAPKGGVHLVELQVSPEHRNRGIGAFLLERVDEYAAAKHAPHISLTTGSDNPARRLYERSGYRVEAEKADSRYERITGSPGRVLMIKRSAR